MDIINLDQDIPVFYVTASSFPAGIAAAQAQIHTIARLAEGRRFFGLSRPENGPIVYRAAAEELAPGEAADSGCATMRIKAGRYVAETITNFPARIDDVGTTFQQLLHQPGIDPQGYCVEWYLNDSDVRCMVRLHD